MISVIVEFLIDSYMAKRTKATPATVSPEDIILDYPPFPGFDTKAFTFFRGLAENNNRDWFTEEKKALYKSEVEEPMKCLLAELHTRFRAEGLPYSPNPKGSIFRLYRDIRFSKDKSPFKTHMGVVIPLANENKKGIGNYIHLEPGNCMFGAGAYFMESPELKLLRNSIDNNPDELRHIIGELEENFGELRGEQLKRTPAGYDEDHPAADLLKFKQMWCSIPFTQKLAKSRDLVDWIVEQSRIVLPLNTYLYRALRGGEPRV